MFSGAKKPNTLKLRERPASEFRALPRLEENNSKDNGKWKKEQTKVKQCLNYLSDHFCPWDYDQYRPDITFFEVWNVVSEDQKIPLKFSVTLKPLAAQGKCSFRARLLQLGHNGFFFAKAASYFSPSRVTRPNDYFGFEADKIITSLGKEKLTSFFVNASYKSSRKPNMKVLASVGIQQKIVFDSSRKLTVRLGYNSRQEIYVTPVPAGLYF
eukprot:jgi/Galph1/3142/GphlegSOOS_G1773.1